MRDEVLVVVFVVVVIAILAGCEMQQVHERELTHREEIKLQLTSPH